MPAARACSMPSGMEAAVSATVGWRPPPLRQDGLFHNAAIHVGHLKSHQDGITGPARSQCDLCLTRCRQSRPRAPCPADNAGRPGDWSCYRRLAAPWLLPDPDRAGSWRGLARSRARSRNSHQQHRIACTNQSVIAVKLRCGRDSIMSSSSHACSPAFLSAMPPSTVRITLSRAGGKARADQLAPARGL